MPLRDAAVIVIGRNEGARLVRCLASVQGFGRVVYVDSGSTDDSVAAAHAAGAQVVALDMDRPFTAARARNAGFEALRAGGLPQFVQFIDGDCEMDPGWPAAAIAAMTARPDRVIVAGRLRERHPEASLYNRLCDAEWNTPVGEAEAVGGIFMARAAAFDAAGGFDAALIAGEEPELCHRLRAAGGRVERLPDEMALHDAAMTRFGQWWARTRRGGHAAAEGARRYGGANRVQVRRAVFWGVGLPVAALWLAATVSPWALLILLAWPAQVVRLALRRGGDRAAWEWAGFMTLGKLAEAAGIIRYHWGRLTRRRQGLIEYK